MAQAQEASERSSTSFSAKPVRVYGVPSSSIDLIWPDAAPLIQKVIARDSLHPYSLEDVLRMLKSRDMQLWVCFNDGGILAAATTQLLVWPHVKSCTIIHVGGRDLPEWIEGLNEAIGSWAKDNGCDELVAFGRKGWEPSLTKLGWKPDTIQYRRKLGG